MVVLFCVFGGRDFGLYQGFVLRWRNQENIFLLADSLPGASDAGQHFNGLFILFIAGDGNGGHRYFLPIAGCQGSLQSLYNTDSVCTRFTARSLSTRPISAFPISISIPPCERLTWQAQEALYHRCGNMSFRFTLNPLPGREDLPAASFATTNRYRSTFGLSPVRSWPGALQFLPSRTAPRPSA